ncbi:hypothetical protein BHE74_00021855 [Ensete ventricosum]|nr:hypothetical protein BHE74_00021855 [Ensete ventricosum]
MLVRSSLKVGRGYQKLVGSSPGARSLSKEITSLPRWHQRVHRKKTKRRIGRSLGVAEKLIDRWTSLYGKRETRQDGFSIRNATSAITGH